MGYSVVVRRCGYMLRGVRNLSYTPGKGLSFLAVGGGQLGWLVGVAVHWLWDKSSVTVPGLECRMCAKRRDRFNLA